MVVVLSFALEELKLLSLLDQDKRHGEHRPRTWIVALFTLKSFFAYIIQKEGGEGNEAITYFNSCRSVFTTFEFTTILTRLIW